MWYNEGNGLLYSGALVTLPNNQATSMLLRRLATMNTIPPRAQEGNTFLYALTEDVEEFAWEFVRYIGITVNPEYRYHQHLSFHDRDASDKNEWIADCLTHGKTPRMFLLEEIPPSINAREREQIFIRFAMEQGADVLNRAITYTDEERIEAQQWREERNARVVAILAKGIYVKRFTGEFYPPRLLSRYAPPLTNPPISMVNCLDICFETKDHEVRSIQEATDNEFETFIRQHIQIAPDESAIWHLIERCEAIEFARYFVGGTLDLFLKEGE